MWIFIGMAIAITVGLVLLFFSQKKEEEAKELVEENFFYSNAKDVEYKTISTSSVSRKYKGSELEDDDGIETVEDLSESVSYINELLSEASDCSYDNSYQSDDNYSSNSYSYDSYSYESSSYDD
jgi:hypothetical protein